MKLLFDHQIFELQQYGGISRYFVELLKQYQNLKLDVRLLLLYSDNAYLKSTSFSKEVKSLIISKDPYLDFLPEINFKGKKLAYLMLKKFNSTVPEDSCQLNKMNSIKNFREGDFDVFHPTYYDDYFLDHIGNKPYVLTVHDLTEEIFPELSIQDKKHKSLQIIDKAARIIAVSENTKRDLISIYGTDESKIDVVHLASSLEVIGSEPENSFKKLLKLKYLLYVGTKTAYKNFYFFLRMFSSMRENNLHVICTGSPFSKNDVEYLKKLGIEDKVHTFFANDEELSHLYQNALAFVFPSLYEGFGIPVLEAFNNNCPVVASNSSSLKEIGQDCVLYFEPKNPESMLDALKKIVSDGELRKKLIEKGVNRNREFSWEKSAKQTIEVYQKAVETHKSGK